MRVVESFLHFFTPRHTNNHKARALHFSSVSTYIAILLVAQILISTVARFNPQVLGYASNISVGDLLAGTNAQRTALGLSPLTLNDQLSSAARAKAADMFANNYWAHNSPQGRDPWSFIIAAGYRYVFAGENLARDFGDSQGVVNAWMNSPTHRENIVNSHYQEIGFAVVNGKLNGNETTLVVQMFGTRPGSAPSVAAPQAPAPVPTPKPVQVTPSTPSAQPATPAAQPAPTDTGLPGQILNLESNQQPKFDIVSVTRNLSFVLVMVLMGVLVIDSALVYRRRIVRVSGHNLAHLMVLIAVLVIINVIGRGIIL